MTDIEQRKAALEAFTLSQDNGYPTDDKTEEFIIELLQPLPIVADSNIEEAIKQINKDGFRAIDPNLWDAIKTLIKAARQPSPIVSAGKVYGRDNLKYGASLEALREEVRNQMRRDFMIREDGK